MTWDDTPDYTKYTLDELCDVARHINRERFPDRYRTVLQEIAQRNEIPAVAAVTYRISPPQRHELFQPDQPHRNYDSIAAWWERRRGFYNRFFVYLFWSSITTSALFNAILMRKYSSYGVGLGIVSELALGIVVFLPLLLAVHLIYTFAYIFDIFLNLFLRFLGWRLTMALFSVLLGATIILNALPVVFLLRVLVRGG